MKKLICALLSVLWITPCMANIHIRSEAVEAVIKQKISNPDAQVAALAEYNAQIKNAGGRDAGVPAAGIWSVCTAAGWDIKTVDGKSKCTDFGNALMKYANWNFRAVCDKDKFMAERGTGRCIDNVFSNKVIGGVKVNMLIATGLAKEYARVKYNDNNLVCSKNPRKTTLPPDDYIQCISMDKNMAYEFKFDSVTATNDAEINAGTETGICKIYDLKYSPLGVTLDTAYSKGESWPAACETTDAKICSKINESMKRFGRSAQIGTTGSKGNKHNACVIKGDGITPTTLRTAFGIDNHAFKKGGIQLNATTAVKNQVCDWVKKTVTNPTITSCVCNDGFTQMYDFSSLITETDDVLTCTINGKPVDFVFDDLSEANKKVAAGGVQGMDCMAAGGTYSGQRCINLNAEQCELLAGANIKNCPNCKRVKFDPKTNSCVLPSSADAANIQKNTNIALIVGGAVVGVGVTVMTGGAGAVVVLTGIETVGAAIELGAQIKIDAIADEFLVKSNQCKSASCAKSLIKSNFQHLADSQNDFSPPEISAIDTEMERLANLIPENDDFWADMALSGLSMAENQSGVFENWTPEQVWRVVGITMQMASIVTSVGKWVGTKTKNMVTKLSKSSNVLKTKTEKVIDVVEHASDQRVLTVKQAELQQKINKVSGTSNKIRATAVAEQLKIIDQSALKGDDIEYYALWKKYAPRNQSFDDFKKMGSVTEISAMSKHWISWDDVERLGLLQSQSSEFLNTNKDAMRIFQTTGSFDKVAEKYPEYKSILDEMEELHARGVPDGFYGNYSTFDPNLSRKIHGENGWAGKTDLQDRIDITKDLSMAHVNTLALDEVAVLRARQLDEIISSSPEYTRLKETFDLLSPSQKQQFANGLIHDLERMNGIYDHATIVPSTMEKGAGAFVRRSDDIFIDASGDIWNTKSKTTGYFDFANEKLYDTFIANIAHEGGGHIVGFENPNAGANGAQLINDIANKTYVSAKENYEAYMLTPTERSAYKIGDTSKKMQQIGENIFKSSDDIIDVLIRGVSQDKLIYSELVDERWRPLGRRLPSDKVENFLREGKAIYKLYGDDTLVIEAYFDDIKTMLNADGLDIVRGKDGTFFIRALQ